ncbi:MAG: hypothetical protein ACTSYH_03535 [Candidatus Heimdallarchaeaceae archaeon]
MALRVSPSEVKEILYDLDSTVTEASIRACILAANLIVTDQLGSSTDLSSAQKKEIERWLAAHFLSIRDPRIEREWAANVGIHMAVPKLGSGIMGTWYGQQAALLDTSGTLASIGKMTARVETLDYVDGGTD